MDPSQVASIESLLRLWARWLHVWKPKLGIVCCLWAELYSARHPVTSDENKEDLDSWQVHAIDAAISDLPPHQRILVEQAWLAGKHIEHDRLQPAYESIAKGLIKRNVIL